MSTFLKEKRGRELVIYDTIKWFLCKIRAKFSMLVFYYLLVELFELNVYLNLIIKKFLINLVLFILFIY